MYTPIQLPYLLDKEFLKHVQYTESNVDFTCDLIICFWEMTPLLSEKKTIRNIVVADGCIDIVVDFDNREIGFSGMKKTIFDFQINTPSHVFGLRLAPGAFYQLTGMDANKAMDNFFYLHVAYPDFDNEVFFNLPYEEAKKLFLSFIESKVKSVVADSYSLLFSSLCNEVPSSTTELYEKFHLSPRQCQRVFQSHYGLTPKMVLNIIRFQFCLHVLTDPRSKPLDVLNIAYYDQSHFLNDFKKNIGITPFELIKRYNK